MILEVWLSSGFASAAMGLYSLHLYKRFINGEGLETLQEPKEAVYMCATEKHWNSPFYINTNSGVGIPVGGGFYDTDKILLERTHIGDKHYYGNNQDIKDPYKKTWYLNTPDDLKAFTEQKGIELTSFPVTLPIRVSTVQYPLLGRNSPFIFHCPSTGILGSNKSLVARSSVYRKTIMTVPGAIAASFFLISSACMALDWDHQKFKMKKWRGDVC